MNTDDPFAGGPQALGGALGEMRGLAASFTGELSDATRAMRDMDGEARRLSRSLSSSLRSAFDKAVFGGEKLTTVFRGLALSVTDKVLDAALRPVSGALSGSFSGAFSGLAGALGSAFFANGGAFSAGRVRAFAKGGVVSGPTLFPMRGGTGLMGEAGPEAILPLERGPDGRLGVASRGGAGVAPVSVTIQTPDAESFRRSRGQVSAQLARAVRRGQARL
jgi:lambda family phage tail tape measure protein